MSFFDIKISKLVKYTKYLDSVIKSSVEDCMEREDIFKLINYCRRLLNVIQNSSNGVNLLCTDIYTFLRKISQEISNHDNNNILLKDKTFGELKSTCERNFLYLKDKYDDILKSNKNPNFEEVIVSIDLNYFLDITHTVEDIFTNLNRHQKELFYYETEDNFLFIYFFRGVDENWYWSPPKKDDKEDLWIKVPNIKIPSGHFVNQRVRKHIEEFIIWLDIFKPENPDKYSFYKFHNKNLNRIDNDIETMKLTKKMNKLDDKVQKGDCVIF